MELIESKQILKNLNAVLLVAKERLAREFIMQDVELNDIFKVDFKNYLSEKNWEVAYFRSTTVITNHQGQNIYVANQWFVIASYFVDFCTELLTYRNLFVKLCKEYLGLNAEEMKKYATRLKTCPTIADEQLFLEKAMSLLVKDFPEKQTSILKRLCTFGNLQVSTNGGLAVKLWTDMIFTFLPYLTK